MGRPNNELLFIESKKAHPIEKVSDGVYVSCFQFSLKEYIRARRIYCSTYHQSECHEALTVAELVLTEGYLYLSSAFAIIALMLEYS